MDFFFYFKSRQGEMVRLLKELVIRESPTHEKKAVDTCSNFIIEEFKKLGCRLTRFPQKEVGDFYLINYYGQKKNKQASPLLILTHIDTVWPVGKISQMPFYISGDKIYGPGALDMKAGLVMVFSAIKSLFDLNIKPQRPISVFINSAEETGWPAAHEIILKLARQAAYVLCLEPALPGGALKTQRKGRMVIRIETKGKSAHAGTPEKGVNAINELINQLEKLKRIQKGGITANVGLIGGGEKPNIVPDKAWAVVDLRFWTSSQKNKILEFFHALKPSLQRAKIKYYQESFTPPLEKSAASIKFYNQVKNIAENLGLKLSEGRTGGGSDASIASSTGVPTLDGLGPDGDGLHAENEHLLLPSLIERTALLTELIRQL